MSIQKKEIVVLVDCFDKEIGTCEKLLAHIEGKLHRAVSVFLFNRSGEMLLQQRAFSKYHSGGLWTNACCTHPKPGELPIQAANRRLFEEMGLKCDIHKIFDFTYKALLDNNLTEHEFDHVFIGYSNEVPNLNPKEAYNWKWISMENLEKEIKEHPEKYTSWFKIILKEILKHTHSN
jgi:isopentenyl-diphosphate delta-isomerase